MFKKHAKVHMNGENSQDENQVQILGDGFFDKFLFFVFRGRFFKSFLRFV